MVQLWGKPVHPVRPEPIAEILERSKSHTDKTRRVLSLIALYVADVEPYHNVRQVLPTTLMKNVHENISTHAMHTLNMSCIYAKQYPL